MSEDMESKGIFFDLQWKTKTGVSSEEFASIGIWEVDDSSLDWLNFKPYLCQTLGNVENLSISYVDSDGDVIPIDSDCEFQEAVKYARRKAAMGQKMILKVEKLDSQSGGTELSSSPIYIKSSNFIKERFKIHTNNAEEHSTFRLPAAEGPIKIGNLSCKVKSKSKTKDVLCPLQTCDSPPMWFKKYMQKMKSEIVSEVTASVSCQVKKLLEDLGHKGPPIVFPAGSRFHSGSDFTDAWLITKTKKKIVDDDSSDGAPKVEIRDSKILKKIEKIHRREKKLDHKKEKLEQKSKKIAERKEREYLSKLRLERAGCKRSHNESLSQKQPREAEIILTPRRKPKAPENIEKLPPPPLDPECSQVGVAVHVDDKRAMAVKRGSKFTKVWKVMNTGNVLWTDETEVRLSWGSAGLDPETRVLKCPPLPPGELGDISINFTAPDYPGLFESHWHFFHENIRFGKSISFIISVEPITNSENEQRSYQNLSPVNSAEFCMIPSTSFEVNNEKDNMVGNEGESNSSSATEETLAGSASQEKIIPKISSFSSVSIPMGSIDDQDDTIEKEDSLSDKRKGLEFESISTDDLSGSVASLGSDSDDNFVVVPMPPCFRFDVPLNADEIAAKTENTETKEVPQSPNHQQQTSSQEIVNNENAETANITNVLPTQERSEVSRDTGEVISVPVTTTVIPPLRLREPKVANPPTTPVTMPATIVIPIGLRRSQVENPPTIPVTIPVTATKTPLFAGICQPQVTMPPTTSPSVPVIATKTPLFAGLSHPQVAEPPTTSASPRQSPEPQVPPITKPLKSHSSINAPKNTSSASIHPPTSPQESPNNSGIRGSPLPTNIPGSQQKNGSRPPSSSSRSSSRPIDLMPPVVSEVWNGARNATASALSSAFAALDSILVNPSGMSDSNGHVYADPPSGPQQPVHPQRPLDVKMINNLSKLANMGFCNLHLNEALLRVHNHNIAEVVDALLGRDDMDPLPTTNSSNFH